MNKQTNILVYPAGYDSSLEILLGLKDVMNLKVIGATNRVDHSRMLFENLYENFPSIRDDHFISELNQLIEKEKIDLILPTHDTILVFMAKNADKINTKLAIPGLQQAEICRSKKKIYDLFQAYPFCPLVFKDLGLIENFPVYAKLDEGQGSKGAFMVQNKSQLEEIKDPENFVVTEYLPGEELTIDCFTDRHGEVKFVGPRVRLRVFDGVCVNSHSVPLTEEIQDIAKIVSDNIKIRGSWYFQLKKDAAGHYKLLEASVKIAGNMNLFRGIGVNFPLLMVYDYLDYDVDIIKNDYKIEVDRALTNRYFTDLEYNTIYIDFDDTITKKERVNASVMQFLYYQKNKKRRIILITKHAHEINQTLDNLAIHKSIFDEIIHIDMADEKHSYIKETENVIFIDNAYGERMKVKKNLGIPVFDVDAIGTLIDWRE
jgi:ATP-grasp in the biosynthetic pathway with Ter operon